MCRGDHTDDNEHAPPTGHGAPRRGSLHDSHTQKFHQAPFRDEDMHEAQCHAVLQQQYNKHGDRQAARKTGCYSLCHGCSLATVRNPQEVDISGTSGALRPTGSDVVNNGTDRRTTVTKTTALTMALTTTADVRRAQHLQRHSRRATTNGSSGTLPQENPRI